MKTLGIMKETKNKWESRVPLNPEAVHKLIERGFSVIVQPSDNRTYTNDEYARAGAIVQDDLTQCDLILGVKEIPEEQILPGKPHMFFSHTIKGQAHNMPMLKHILDVKATLFDYETVVDEGNKRLIFFGRYAGSVGMLETLWGYGQRVKTKYGIDTPFLELKRPYEYQTTANAIAHLRQIGEEITKTGFAAKLCPLTIFLTGYGNVSLGAQDILSALPVERISPDDLYHITRDHRRDRIYLVVFEERHMAERIDGSHFDLQEYFKNGKLFRSRMGRYLPYCSMYVNAIFWTPSYPRFLAKSDLAYMPHLEIIGDITCDIDGSVEPTVRACDIDSPIFLYNPADGSDTPGWEGDGTAVMSIDNLPCEFSREASDAFTRALLPIMDKILLHDYSTSVIDSALPEEIKKSCIAHRGVLKPNYQHLYQYLPK